MTEQPAVTLDDAQARLVTVQYLARWMCMMKQYLTESQAANYRWIIQEMATLPQRDAIAESYDKCWPNDLKWESLK